jgi:putative FmdB family regulatory protein
VPMYEYTCEACGESFEQLVRSMQGEHKVQCPKCASASTKRALSVFAVSSESGGSRGDSAGPGMCGRCGGPGPCGRDD